MTFSSALQPVESGMNANVHRSLQFLVAPPSLFLGRFKGGGRLSWKLEEKWTNIILSSAPPLEFCMESEALSLLTESIHPLE